MAAYVCFVAARAVLAFVDIPLQLEIGLGLALSGLALVFTSLIMERIKDARGEHLTE